MLKRLNVVKTRRTKAGKVFLEHISEDFMQNSMTPAEYVSDCWKKYKKYSREERIAKGSDKEEKENNALNGSVFEIIIATALIKEGIVPLHLQAKIAFVPNVEFDIVLYTAETGPIGISLKTSLRERYKQADLEAIALKYVHRKAKNYLLTLDEKEAISVKNKILDGDILGIDEVIVATSDEFNELVDNLKLRTLITPEKVDVISAVNVVTKAIIDVERARQTP